MLPRPSAPVIDSTLITLTSPLNSVVLGGPKSGGGPAGAAIDSFKIVNTTSLDSANGLYLGTNYGYDLHGYGAEVVCNDLGLSSLPVASAFHMRIRNPGYKNKAVITRDTVLVGLVIGPLQGVSTTFSYNYLYDTSVGGKRKFWVVFAYDPVATNALANTGVDVCRWVDQVHTGTTIVSVTVDVGWYGAAAAGTVNAPVNLSTLPYLMPEVHPLDFERDYFGSGTTSKTVRFKVSHMYGQSGRMFDTAEISGKDASTHETAKTTITDVVLSNVTVPDSNVSTGGMTSTICMDSYLTSGLTAGDLCYDHIKVWPLIGTPTEIYDSANYEGDANIDDMRSPRRWKYDPSGTYGQVFAVVDPTQVGPGLASTNLTTATLATNRFISWETAVAGIKAINLASFGHSDIGAAIIYGYNTSGVDVVLAVGASLTAVQAPVGDTACFFKQHPSNTANLIFDTSASAHNWPAQIIFDGCPPRKSAAGSLAPNAGPTDGKCISVRNCIIHLDTGTGANPWMGSNWNRIFYENIQFASTSAPNVGQFGMGLNGANPIYCKVAHGVWNNTTAQMPTVPYTICGVRGHVAPIEPGSGQPSNVGFIANNLKMVKGINGGTAQFAGSSGPYTGRGCHLEQFSYDAQSLNEDFGTGSDGTLQALDNVVNSYGVNPPLASDANATTGRNNTAYSDVANSQGIFKHVRQRMMHDGRWANKTSWFAYGTALAGRVANWKTWFQVGWMMNTMSFLRDPGVPPYTTFPQAGSDNPYWAGACQTYNTGYGVGVPAYTLNTQADGTLNEGTYQPTGGVGSPNWGRVLANHHTLKYDMKGVLRLNDNTAMNGPYEHL